MGTPLSEVHALYCVPFKFHISLSELPSQRFADLQIADLIPRTIRTQHTSGRRLIRGFRSIGSVQTSVPSRTRTINRRAAPGSQLAGRYRHVPERAAATPPSIITPAAYWYTSTHPITTCLMRGGPYRTHSARQLSAGRLGCHIHASKTRRLH